MARRTILALLWSFGVGCAPESVPSADPVVPTPAPEPLPAPEPAPAAPGTGVLVRPDALSDDTIWCWTLRDDGPEGGVLLAVGAETGIVVEVLETAELPGASGDSTVHRDGFVLLHADTVTRVDLVDGSLQTHPIHPTLDVRAITHWDGVLLGLSVGAGVSIVLFDDVPDLTDGNVVLAGAPISPPVTHVDEGEGRAHATPNILQVSYPFVDVFDPTSPVPPVERVFLPNFAGQLGGLSVAGGRTLLMDTSSPPGIWAFDPIGLLVDHHELPADLTLQGFWCDAEPDLPSPAEERSP